MANPQNSDIVNDPPLYKKATKTIAIVDDEPDILELLGVNLEKVGFRVQTFENGEEFFVFVKNNKADLIVLDVMLPDSDGFEICKYLKNDPEYSSTPVIMLTARGTEMEKILGLELGADDYVTKPFSPRELVARVKAVLRRDSGKETVTNQLTAGDNVLIDLQKYEVYIDNKKVDLTSSEFKIIKLLAEKPGWVYSRDQILDFLGGSEKGVLDRTVDVHIRNLREKLGQSGKLIKNIRGVGYKLEK